MPELAAELACCSCPKALELGPKCALGQACVLQVFVQEPRTLVSGSKDGHVRCWDLSTQHCFQTLVSPAHEVGPLCFVVWLSAACLGYRAALCKICEAHCVFVPVLTRKLQAVSLH